MSSEELRRFTPDEYQQIMLDQRSQKGFAIFLNISTEEAKKIMSKYKVKLPPDYVRSLDVDYIIERTIIHGSFNTAAKEFGVSRSFLTKILQQKKTLSTYYEAKPRWTKTVFEKEIKRIGSVSLMARVYKCTESHVRKYAASLKVNLSESLDYDDTGFANAKGRRAELLFKEKRVTVTRDCNETLGSKAEYDFDDKIFSRINVKSSQIYKYKAQARKGKFYWKFSTKGCKNADVFALLFMDNKENHLHTMYVSAESVAALGKQTITIDSDHLASQDINSIHIIDLNEENTQIDE